MQTKTKPLMTLRRPLRDFLLQLPLLPVNDARKIDYAAADPALLVYLAINADTCEQTIRRGISGIGHLLACGASGSEQAEIPGDCIEAVGYLLAELGDLANVAYSLATECRRYTADYVSPQAPSRQLAQP